MQLIDMKESEINIQLTFADNKAISQEILEPDSLIVTIAQPWLIVDAETSEPLSYVPTVQSIELALQYNDAEFLELQENAKKAVSAGIAVSIWQLVIIVLFKKVLFSMWVLILTLQFFVFMSMWQVRYPHTLTFLLSELKRIALGEFMDDFDVMGIVMEWLGNEQSKTSSPTDEQVGESRLGTADAMSSLGPTLMLASMGFLLLIIIVVVILVLARRMKCSNGTRELVGKIRRAVFWNAIIRYLILNSLKLNLSGMLVLKLYQSSTQMDMAIAIGILAFINGIPFVFIVLLERKHS